MTPMNSEVAPYQKGDPIFPPVTITPAMVYLWRQRAKVIGPNLALDKDSVRIRVKDRDRVRVGVGVRFNISVCHRSYILSRTL